MSGIKSFSSNQIQAAFNIFIILFVLSDCYLLSPKLVKDKFDYTEIRTLPGKFSRHEVQEINTVSGRKIIGSENYYVSLMKGSEVVILKSRLLNRNLYLEFSDNSNNHKIPIGLLNDIKQLTILFILSFLLSTNYLFSKPLFKLNEMIFYIISTVIYILILFFYTQ